MRLAVLLAGLALALRRNSRGPTSTATSTPKAMPISPPRSSTIATSSSCAATAHSIRTSSPRRHLRRPLLRKAPLQRYLAQHPNLKKYEPLMTQAAHDYAVELPLLKAVMAAESGFNADAVSPKGAIGLMQVMPATAERYGLQADKRRSVSDKLADPKTNIRLGARYLRDLMRLFPDQLTLVLASYNAGEGAVQKYRNSVPPYPETQNYVKLVTQFYHLYKPAPPASPAQAGAANGRVTLTLPGRANLPTRPVPEQ